MILVFLKIFLQGFWGYGKFLYKDFDVLENFHWWDFDISRMEYHLRCLNWVRTMMISCNFVNSLMVVKFLITLHYNTPSNQVFWCAKSSIRTMHLGHRTSKQQIQPLPLLHVNKMTWMHK